MVKFLLQYSYILEVALCLVVLAAMVWRHVVSHFKVLSILLLTRICSRSIVIGLLFHRTALHLSLDEAFRLYVTLTWVNGIVDGALVFVLIYTTFWEAMRPLEGLHNIGKVIFRWVSGVSIAFAATVAFGPHEGRFLVSETLASRFDDGISVLTICLLLFV